MSMNKKRQVRVEDGKAYVPLTRGYEAIIDVDDIPLVEGFNWGAVVRKHTVYAVRHERKPGGSRICVLMHRVIANAPADRHVDHRDCNGLCNERKNLRLVTASQNIQNQRKSTKNTSGVKGVSWHKAAKKWSAYISLQGKRTHLGLFESLTDAASAYAEASNRLHGEFGRVS